LIAQSIGVNNYVRAEVSGDEITIKVRGLGHRGEIDSIVLAPRPQMFSAVNSASLSPDLACGGALTILGRNLSATSFQSGLKDPHLNENGCSVTLNGQPVPILSAGAAQMNLQIPFTFVGPGTLQMVSRNGSANLPVQVAPVAPQFFVNPDGSIRAAHADGSPVTASSPARGSEAITLFATGLGAVSQPTQAGILPHAGVTAIANVQVTLGGQAVQTMPAVLSVTEPGTYQIQVQVPGGLTGPLPVQATANAIASNAPFLPIAAV
jgi:uncharacterized protein (TIGR03437 family)